ncbi:MAG: helix-turn-helix domain-containing protein [Halanaeroarchaeum sp.]
MSLIAEIRLPAADFEVGRVLSLGEGMSASFERVVPSGSSTIPYLWIRGRDPQAVLERVEDHRDVADVVPVDDGEGTLFAMDWHVTDDPFLTAVDAVDGTVYRAEGARSAWEFDVEFPTHEALEEFQGRCRDHDVSLRLERLFVPTATSAGPWFGLTERQYRALTLAVREGYYDIPREITTLELADHLGISDQAVTERLRRGISTLVENSLLLAHDS